MPGLRVRAWLARRMLAPDFQRRAIAFPLTRFVARRRAAALFSLASGFVGSQVLSACLRLGVLDALAEGPCRRDEMATVLGLPMDRLHRLLDAAQALRLVVCRGDWLVLGPLGTAVLGNAGARAMIEHHDALYDDLADAAGLVRGEPRRNPEQPAPAGSDPAGSDESVSVSTIPPEEPGSGAVARLWSYAGPGAGPAPEAAPAGALQVAAYSRLMTRSQPLLAADVLDAVPLGRCRALLDVGGGEGEFAAAAARRHSDLRVSVFDLPEVCAAAREHLGRLGLAQRVQVYSGSFMNDPLPGGADVISLVRILLDHDDAAALAILQAVRAALPAGGRVLIAEPMAGAYSSVDAYFAAYFLAMGQGRLRRPGELARLLKQAGFWKIARRRTRMPMLARVMVAVVAPATSGAGPYAGPYSGP